MDYFQIAVVVILFLLGGGGIIFGLLNTFDTRRGHIKDLNQLGKETKSSTSSFMDKLPGLRTRINELLSVLVSPKSEEKLLAAHWPITFVEYTLMRLVLMVIVFLLVWVFTEGIIPGILLAVLSFFIPNLAMEWSIKNRKNKFDKQLIDVLVLLTGGIRAGFSFLQAMDHVIKEMPPPISVELNRVTQEVRLGVSLQDALSHLADRMDNKDLNLVVTTIIISQRVGGNMTEMMEIVTETIRARTRLFSEVQSLTSNQRFTGQLLTFLPAIVAGVLYLINPLYMGNLFKPELIWLPIGALIMILIGNIIVRRLVKFDF